MSSDPSEPSFPQLQLLPWPLIVRNKRQDRGRCLIIGEAPWRWPDRERGPGWKSPALQPVPLSLCPLASHQYGIQLVLYWGV